MKSGILNFVSIKVMTASFFLSFCTLMLANSCGKKDDDTNTASTAPNVLLLKLDAECSKDGTAKTCM